MTADLAKSDSSGGMFDQKLERALKRFQKRHGLPTTGRTDPGTIQALNIPVSERLRQIEETISKLKSLPKEMGPRFILVNIPESWLYVFEEDRPLMKMKIITGRPEHQTPTLNSVISRIVINPDWIIPKSGLEQALGLIKSNPNYLDDANIQVLKGYGSSETEIDPKAVDWTAVSSQTFVYHLRQQPGPSNPLGRIQFLFPNKFSIHLHDTPLKGLFEERDRARSLGCVRVERAVDLAAFLLKSNPRWTRERILDEINAGFTRTAWLEEPIDIHIVYWNAWMDAQGILQFRDDERIPDAPQTQNPQATL